MNFNVVEGDYSEEFYNRFIKEYNDENNKIKDVCSKLDISRGKFYTIKNILVERGLINRCKRSPKPKYYYKNSNRFVIIKNDSRGVHRFLSFSDECQAKKAVELYKEYGWDKKFNEIILKKVLGEV